MSSRGLLVLKAERQSERWLFVASGGGRKSVQSAQPLASDAPIVPIHPGLRVSRQSIPKRLRVFFEYKCPDESEKAEAKKN